MLPTSTENLHFEDIHVLHIRAAMERVFDFPSPAQPRDFLIHIQAGQGVLWVNDLPLFTLTNQVAYIPHTGSYTLRLQPGTECTLVAFQLYREGSALSLPRELQLDADLSDLFEALANTTQQAGFDPQLRQKELLFSLLRRVAPELIAAFSPGFARIYPGAAALFAGYLENTAISQYAALCGLRENRFRALFTEYFTLSPVEYRNTLRMKYAQDLMANCQASVAEAARAAGFTSVSYFCRLHKKMYGTSPANTKEELDD